jgi:hypothetical protein
MGCSDESHNKSKGRWHDEHAETPDDNQGCTAVDQDGTEAYRTRHPTTKGIPHHSHLRAISRLIVAACRLMPSHVDRCLSYSKSPDRVSLTCSGMPLNAGAPGHIHTWTTHTGNTASGKLNRLPDMCEDMNIGMQLRKADS